MRGKNFEDSQLMQNRSCYLLEHQWKETQYNVAKKQEEGNYLKKF